VLLKAIRLRIRIVASSWILSED